MAKLAIIADDLTGALDSAAPFAARGLVTRVALTPQDLPAALSNGPDIVAVSTNSRELPPDAAREVIRSCVSALPAGIRLFKKVDSRLKGNIAAELDTLPFTRALVVPAIPGFGRWQRHGLLGGFGIGQAIDIALCLEGHAAHAHIPTIEHEHDIDAVLDMAEYDLPVGSRALAEAMAKRLRPMAPMVDISTTAKNVIMVIGSTDPITLAQVGKLRKHCPDVVTLSAPAGLYDGALPADARAILIQATPSIETIESGHVARRLAGLLRLIDPEPGTFLLISGGATAHAILLELGLSQLHLEGEILPGLPLARAGHFTLVTKSGGFGEPDCLRRVLAAVVAQEQESRIK